MGLSFRQFILVGAFCGAMLLTMLPHSRGEDAAAPSCQSFRIGKGERVLGQVSPMTWAYGRSKIIGDFGGGGAVFQDLETGKQTTVRLDARPGGAGGFRSFAGVSQDRKHVLLYQFTGIPSKYALVLKSLADESERIIPINEPFRGVYYAAGTLVYLGSKSEKCFILRPGESKPRQLSGPLESLSPDGKWGTVGGQLVDLGSKSFDPLKFVNSEGQSAPCRVVPTLGKDAFFDGDRVLCKDDQGNQAVVDPNSGSSVQVPLGARIRPGSLFTIQGNRVFSVADGTLHVADLANNQQEAIELLGGAIDPNATFESLHVSPQGDSVLVVGANKVVLADLKRKSSVNFSSAIRGIAAFSADGQSIVGADPARTMLRKVPTESICVKPVKVDSDCAQCTEDRRPSVSSDSAWMTKVAQTALCQSEYDPQAWLEFAPPPKPDSTLSREEAKRLLLRFQRLGGFEPKRDLGALVGILRSPVVPEEKDLVAGALQSVFHTSPDLYRELIPQGVFGELPEKPSTSCRTPDELETLKKEALDQLKERLGRLRRSTIWDWNDLRPLGGVLSQLSDEQKEELRDAVAQNLADSAVAYYLRGVFVSKVYKFTYQKLAPFFGESEKPLTDFTYARNLGELAPFILGTQRIQGATRSNDLYGFHFSNEKSIRFGGLTEPGALVVDQTYQWKQGGKTFKADLKATVGRVDGELVTKEKSPSYNELWADGKLSGIVIPGSNLGKEGAPLMDEYLAYYQANGFKFGPKFAIGDAKAFLAEKIQSGEADYLIKEAHSDGDDRNLFQLYSNAEALKGAKSLPNGKTEEVTLIFYPRDRHSVNEERISNNEFASWIQQRDQAKKGQFVYFNTSCWSAANKAVNEIEAAKSKTLLNIATLTEANNFVNKPGNAEYKLLSAFREGKSFEQMRNAVRGGKKFAESVDDYYIFPDEPAYKEHILDKLDTPLNIELSVEEAAH